MTEVIVNTKVLKVYPSFIWGYCKCGCGRELKNIIASDKYTPYLQFYLSGHATKKNYNYPCIKCKENPIKYNELCSKCYSKQRNLKLHLESPMIDCACGCGQQLHSISISGNEQHFIIGHWAVGERSPSYNNGRSNNREYGLIRDFNHPNCNKVGYVPLHVYNFTVREGKLFCCMLKWGVVHHVIHKKKGGSDDLSNLQGMTRKQHGQVHNPKQDPKERNERCIYPDCKNPTETALDQHGSPHWFHWEDGYICSRCYLKIWNRKQKLLKKKLL